MAGMATKTALVYNGPYNFMTSSICSSRHIGCRGVRPHQRRLGEPGIRIHRLDRPAPRAVQHHHVRRPAAVSHLFDSCHTSDLSTCHAWSGQVEGADDVHAGPAPMRQSKVCASAREAKASGRACCCCGEAAVGNVPKCGRIENQTTFASSLCSSASSSVLVF